MSLTRVSVDPHEPRLKQPPDYQSVRSLLRRQAPFSPYVNDSWHALVLPLTACCHRLFLLLPWEADDSTLNVMRRIEGGRRIPVYTCADVVQSS